MEQCPEMPSMCACPIVTLAFELLVRTTAMEVLSTWRPAKPKSTSSRNSERGKPLPLVVAPFSGHQNTIPRSAASVKK